MRSRDFIEGQPAFLTGHGSFRSFVRHGNLVEADGRADHLARRQTCLQAQAQKGYPLDRCRAVNGREAIRSVTVVTMRVVRWNHSGDPKVTPAAQSRRAGIQCRYPIPPPAGFTPAVGEDFPNGAAPARSFFVVDGPQGRFSWFFPELRKPRSIERAHRDRRY